MALAAERIATGFSDRADHAAERAAVLRADAGRLDLHLFEYSKTVSWRDLPSISELVTTPSTANAFSAPLAPLT